jgi:LacI family transcriptional regulator
VRAVRFIRENACNRILARDVLDHVSASRASLEPRMRQILNRTIHQEIERVRMERVKELLTTTDLEIKHIAQRTAFRSVPYLTRVFHRVLGEAPARYRARMRR